MFFKKKEKEYVCTFPMCEQCEKYITTEDYNRFCTVPVVISKEQYQIWDSIFMKHGKKIIGLEESVRDLEYEISVLSKSLAKLNKLSTNAKNPRNIENKAPNKKTQKETGNES